MQGAVIAMGDPVIIWHPKPVPLNDPTKELTNEIGTAVQLLGDPAMEVGLLSL
jgi:hypothetical protein